MSFDCEMDCLPPPPESEPDPNVFLGLDSASDELTASSSSSSVGFDASSAGTESSSSSVSRTEIVSGTAFNAAIRKVLEERRRQQAELRKRQEEARGETFGDDFISLAEYADWAPGDKEKEKKEQRGQRIAADPSAVSAASARAVEGEEVFDPADPLSHPRAHAPWSGREYLHPNFLLRLHEEILDFCAYMAPTKDDHQRREGVVSRLSELAQRLWPGCEVHPFGSFATKLYLPLSDIDVVVLNGPVPTLDGDPLPANQQQQQGQQGQQGKAQSLGSSGAGSSKAGDLFVEDVSGDASQRHALEDGQFSLEHANLDTLSIPSLVSSSASAPTTGSSSSSSG